MKDSYSNCPISRPVVMPDLEIISFNGFAWSNVEGIMMQSSSKPQEDLIQWLGSDN
jgi:hypothetical protein